MIRNIDVAPMRPGGKLEGETRLYLDTGMGEGRCPLRTALLVRGR